VVEHAGLDLIIGQPRRRTHDHLGKARLAGLALWRKWNLRQHCQPVPHQAQAAQAVGERLGQHWFDRAGEVPRIAARKGLGIQRAGTAAAAGGT